MTTLTVQDRLRMQNVKRWHIVNTARTQSLAEHSFNVAAIVEAIANRVNDDSPGTFDRGAINAMMVMALRHDEQEVFTGDTPSSAKANHPDWPTGLTMDAVIKAADVMDGLLFIEENALGSHAEEVAVWVKHKFQEMIGHLDTRLGRATLYVYNQISAGGYRIEPT